MEKTNKAKKSGGFESLNLIRPLYRAIKAKGFQVPTPIQRKVLPILLENRDCVACSRTGSGKTLSFIIPLINKLQQHSTVIGPKALILLPTWELAIQTQQTLKFFTQNTDIRQCLIVGGHTIEGQFEQISMNPDVIIATPGRLVQYIDEINFKLDLVQTLIIDEADLMFSNQFSEQLSYILSKTHKNRQTMLFSATIPSNMNTFIQAGLKDYVFVKLDQEFTLSENININTFICRETEKLPVLIYLLQYYINKNEKIIIFLATKYHVDYIQKILLKFFINSISIHGNMDIQCRKDIIHEFKQKKQKNILIVTDLAARGIDIPSVDNVIQYDFPQQEKTYIHRAGRTARGMDKKGNVINIFYQKELPFFFDLLHQAQREFEGQKFGRVPQDKLLIIQEKVTHISEDIEIQNIKEVCSRAMLKFSKTRGGASKASNTKSINLQIKIHPDFNYDEQNEEILERIKNFKPKTSCLEIQKNKQIQQTHDESSAKVVQSIQHQKDIIETYKSRKINKLKMKQQIKDMELIQQNENQQEQEIKQLAVINFDKEKQIKRSQMTDFKSKDYISVEPNKKSEFLDNTKVNLGDIHQQVLDNEEQEKKQFWDKKLQKFVQRTTNKYGQQSDRQKAKKDRDFGKVKLKKWQNKHQIQLQNIGEQEDEQQIQLAKDLFTKRLSQKKGYRYNKEQLLNEFGKGKTAKSELKNREEMMKGKKEKRKMKLKNMQKEKRRKVIQKFKK